MAPTIPCIYIYIDADDIALQAVASVQDVVYQTVRILQRLVAVLKALDLSSKFHVAQQVARQVRQHGFIPFKVLEALGMEARGGCALKFSSIRARIY